MTWQGNSWLLEGVRDVTRNATGLKTKNGGGEGGKGGEAKGERGGGVHTWVAHEMFRIRLNKKLAAW